MSKEEYLEQAWHLLMEVRFDATQLRDAQKAYMEDRVNEELGRRVGECAKLLDLSLVAVHQFDQKNYRDNFGLV